MEAGGVQVQYQPYTQDPSRQPWKNTNQNSEQQFKQRRNGDSSGNAMINRTNHPTTPKSAQFPKSPNFATFINKNSNSSQQGPLKSPSNNNKNKSNNNNNNSNSSNNLSRSPPKSDKNITTILQQKNTNFNRSAPKPLNLSKATQLQNLGKVPQSAVFPQKINRNYNLPNPPKTATFPKNSNGFPKDIRQSTLRFPTIPSSATALMYNEQYLNVLDQSRFRYYNPNPMPARFATSSNCSQVELGLGTPMAALCHPDDSDSQESSPQTPIFLSSENFAGSADVYDLYNLQHHPHEDELLLDDNQKYYHHYYHYFDQSQEYIPPSTPTSNIHHHHQHHHQQKQQQQQQQRSNITHERRKSVFGGPMKVHPDAVLPIRQPKGPEMARNFTTRIRRKAVNKLHAATAERRNKQKNSEDKVIGDKSNGKNQEQQ